MSLYSHEEICLDCDDAVFHECCNKFCNCRIHAAGTVNHLNGTCASKTIRKGCDTCKKSCVGLQDCHDEDYKYWEYNNGRKDT